MSDWTANDYSNIVTISAAAIGSVLLIVFKSRCSKISLCCGVFSCDRKVTDEDHIPPDPEILPPVVAPVPPPAV